jgi:hypothetical protein
MGRTFVKPLFNVKMNDMTAERTTLKSEEAGRRFGTGRGYCVTADSEREAIHIAAKYQCQTKHSIRDADSVQLLVHRGVPVLMDAPRW